MTDPSPEALTAHDLLQDLRRQDPDAIEHAYRVVFSGPVGRFVLAHQLAEAGIGATRGPARTAEDRAYHDGRADHAMHLLARAGFDQFSAVVAVATDQLEGQDNDRHLEPGGPDVQPG